MLPRDASQLDDIHAALRELAERKENFEMTTIYKGVPITQKFSRIEFSGDQIQFRPPHQICCVTPSLSIYIYHESLPNCVVTSVQETNRSTGIITATKLSMLDHCWKSRSSERVQPRQPLRAVLAISHWSISASVADISSDGLGLLIYGMTNKGLDIQPNMPVQSGIRLPGTNLPLVLSGTVVRINKIGSSAMVSLGIKTYPNDKQARLLKSYISSRQSEILDELAQTVQFAMEPAQTKDMFF